MPFARTPPEQYELVDGWKPTDDFQAAVQVWIVKIGGAVVRYEGDYHKAGDKLLCVTGPTIESVLAQLPVRK